MKLGWTVVKLLTLTLLNHFTQQLLPDSQMVETHSQYCLVVVTDVVTRLYGAQQLHGPFKESSKSIESEVRWNTVPSFKSHFESRFQQSIKKQHRSMKMNDQLDRTVQHKNTFGKDCVSPWVSESVQLVSFHKLLRCVCACLQAEGAVCEADVSPSRRLWAQGWGAALEEGLLWGHPGYQDKQEGKCLSSTCMKPLCVPLVGLFFYKCNFPCPPQHIHSRSTLECAYRTHLIAGVGFYQHLLLYIQSHYQLELQDCIDWTHVTDPLIGSRSFTQALFISWTESLISLLWVSDDHSWKLEIRISKPSRSADLWERRNTLGTTWFGDSLVYSSDGL